MRYLLFLLLLTPSVVKAQSNDADSLGLPGDNFDLYGVLELFKKAESISAFEEAINKQSNEVNNLDLDEDGNVDYVQVVDNMSKDTHALVLRVAVSETETQDIAVIGIEKSGENNAVLQIVGDEELYGKDYILEPADEVEEKSGRGPAAYSPNGMARAPIVIVNVWYWPGVRYMYAPGYVVWRSPWRWRAYPVWWSPWHPVAWRVHHARVVRYRHVYCRRVTVYRVHHARRVYSPHRAAAPSVQRRTAARRANNPAQVQRSQQTQRNQPAAQNTQRNTQTKQNKQAVKAQNRPAAKAQTAPRNKAGKAGGGRAQSKPAGTRPR
ncbi:MAG: hypothetical protein IM638_07315 [Bacteroidetes bacterium]|nr:hypothetical protein [Bacteroidota bacterium]